MFAYTTHLTSQTAVVNSSFLRPTLSYLFETNKMYKAQSVVPASVLPVDFTYTGAKDLVAPERIVIGHAEEVKYQRRRSLRKNYTDAETEPKPLKPNDAYVASRAKTVKKFVSAGPAKPVKTFLSSEAEEAYETNLVEPYVVAPASKIRRFKTNISVTPVVPFKMPSELVSADTDEGFSPTNTSVAMGACICGFYIIQIFLSQTHMCASEYTRVCFHSTYLISMLTKRIVCECLDCQMRVCTRSKGKKTRRTRDSTNNKKVLLKITLVYVINSSTPKLLSQFRAFSPTITGNCVARGPAQESGD